MFYVAPLLCIALLAWVERDAPRPRLLAAVAAVVSALLVVAIPLDRFLTTSAITDTLMLLAVLVAPGPDRRRTGSDGRGARARRRARRGVPLRAPPLRARAAAARARSLDPRDQADLVGDARLRAVLARRALPGHPHGRQGLGRSGAAVRRARRVPLDRADRSAHGEPERVLQPRRRSRLLRHRSDARRLARDARADRSADRRGDASRRRAGARPLPPRRLLVRAGRRAARAGRGLGHHALARACAARLGGP